jgi:hypothetical protein
MLNMREAVPSRSQKARAAGVCRSMSFGSGAVIEGILMGEGQRPRSPRLTRPGMLALLAVCLLSLAGLSIATSPAGADESHPTPEPAPQSAPSASPEAPQPDATPQTSQPSPSAAAPAPVVPSAPVAPSVTASSPARAGSTATRTPSNHAIHPRRGLSSAKVRRRARHAHRASGERSPARNLAGSASAGAPAVLAAPNHRDGTLLLASALAMCVLSLAGLSLLRLLAQFARLSHEGPR